ncbi:bifunctional GNAT family N-acetyltransferase/carbon-nitrogen hydrolase family protein [Weeksella virosa]|uniref:Nitrilase/cyanide hydratase and apolipoprotein N-acyltransferase n=2 Tax=Weeksella TaxID=1013 RepID=F0P1B4_WEEVC|nr:bifunctional GNAT family N-acetyltransferase/carbon-nitrogen hydrolase family protein [Weeksella virosa]ADX68628.1 Nitrilase/cyanide hydratase and apolipoprotein N-acyltransferase [Weeksella virosa DSM 16922]MDK7375839.1 bifunctional GNAT family N-acetyltransferase/carbon-nitrogen hydrolase family protein [Weeksella virosa]VEH63708.1 N-carbamoyl-D-amino acid hydrolase [Weeksella virosa]
MDIQVRRLTIEDYEDLLQSEQEAYKNIDEEDWQREDIHELLRIFPEGQFCVEVDGKVVASALAIIVNSKKVNLNTSNYEEITSNGKFTKHDPDGDVMYGIEIFVHPQYRQLRLGRRLYDVRKELCEEMNLKSIVAGGRIPNYHKYAAELTPREYVDKVKRKEIIDSTLTFQLANDFHVKKILKNYLKDDTESMEYATLLEWNNIYYEPDLMSSSPTKRITRIGLVQWQMRAFRDLQDFYEQVEFFVQTVSDYGADFLLFPEFFNTPLMSPYNHLKEVEAMNRLAELTDEIVKKIQEFAISYNVNIIAGSMPTIENELLFNTSFLCHRNGQLDSYSKMHITPNEFRYYGMVGGNELKVFDTDCGKIGLLICYDVEFPETARILADQGMQILFVPFMTDTQNGYTRVRSCAQARAIENECYVAIAGSVGNLPRVNNMDIQFSQSAVFTPSDFAFPTNGVKSEATPNTEMVLITDVDLYALKDLHEYGTVKTLKDRRHDMYRVVKPNVSTVEKPKNS